MSKYTINTDLYQKALAEIYDDYMSKNPIRSELARATIENSVRDHAVNTFSQIWQSTVRMNEDHIAYRATQTAAPVVDLGMERKIAGLDESGRQMMRNFRRESSAMMQKNSEGRQKLFDDNHRFTLVLLFSSPNGGGLSKATAEKIVDEHILIHRDV